MKSNALIAVLAAALLLGLQAGQAAQPTRGRNPLDVIPAKIPFGTPYGAPITLRRALAVTRMAMAEATRRGWPMSIAVVDSGANLVSFQRMDGAMLASISIAEHKARAALMYRRPTHVFENGVQRLHYDYVVTLDGVIASRGGIPLVENGRIVGAVGCSGGAGSQDEAVCEAAAAQFNR